MKFTSAEYLHELLEDAISAAVDYGAEPSDENEKALSWSTDLLYNALDILRPSKDQ